jgi:N-sulfoglucosamine sulfohydrolase
MITVWLSSCINTTEELPNILFCISDDQSWVHTSITGTPDLCTPGFERVAREGILFKNAYCAAPSCAPSRASILSGRHIYDLKEGGLLFGGIRKDIDLFSDLLQKNGYDVGYTGKVYGPGNMDGESYWGEEEIMGREYMKYRMRSSEEVGPYDYSRNFKKFLKNNKKAGKPFLFWYGSYEPHRPFDQGIGAQNGINADSVPVPDFLPDNSEIRTDIADYLYEIEWFDSHLLRMINLLEKKGELDNTIIIVTSDNGMPFPRAKATLYEYGTHMPLAIMWGDRIKGGRTVDDFINTIDFAPTLLEAAGMDIPEAMTGSSFLDILQSSKEGLIDPQRNMVVTAIERHTYCRPGGLPYPSRGIRKDNWTYIMNFEPERYPAGHPKFKGHTKQVYGDVDGGITKDYMIENKDEANLANLFELGFGKRPMEELYNLSSDQFQLNNLAYDTAYASIKAELKTDLFEYLTDTHDPRMKGESPWDYYPYFVDEYIEKTRLPIEERDTIFVEELKPYKKRK